VLVYVVRRLLAVIPVMLVVATAGGEIFWVEGLRLAEKFKLTPETRRRLVWRWRCS